MWRPIQCSTVKMALVLRCSLKHLKMALLTCSSSTTFQPGSVKDWRDIMVAHFGDLKQNFTSLQNEWDKLQGVLRHEETLQGTTIPTKHGKGCDELVTVKRSELSQLCAEALQLKETLPKVLRHDVLTAYSDVDRLQHENVGLREVLDKSESACKHWKTLYQNAISDHQKEKQENIKLQCQIHEVSEQLGQQSDYCSNMGAAFGTLLWRVSRSEDSVQVMLNGSKVDEFLTLVNNTLQSFILAYNDDWPQEESSEVQFILALCGTVTNLAASAYGRDFLLSMPYGEELFETFMTVLARLPSDKCCKVKGLLLMSLYNATISPKGLRLLTTREGTAELLLWLIQNEVDAYNRVHILKLLQSLVCDDNNPSFMHKVKEKLTADDLQALTRDKCCEVRDMALELISDLNYFSTEQ